MAKITPTKPLLVCFFGFPGSGKSFLARNLADSVNLADVSADRIRGEIFAKPRYDTTENAIVSHLMDYMAAEFLNSGVSVAYDINASSQSQRRRLREVAKKYGANFLLVWIQIDVDSAFARTQRRDRRTADDKYAQPLDKAQFDAILATMHNPEGEEDYVVVSGKHAFVTQKNAIVSRLYRDGLVSVGTVQGNVTAKPGLVNLVPNPRAGRVDFSRRNISIS